jgi:hypothetical protein
MVEEVRPILAPPSASPAEASRPDVSLEDGRWHVYESNPVPWWIAFLWIGFVAFALVYLLKSMIH